MPNNLGPKISEPKISGLINLGLKSMGYDIRSKNEGLKILGTKSYRPKTWA